MDFFVDWEKSIASNTNNKNKESCMISHQTRQHIISSILGFEELCKLRFKKTNASVIPSRLNSDVVENVFCQQRTLQNPSQHGSVVNDHHLGLLLLDCL
jgi:hypothetical protein